MQTATPSTNGRQVNRATKASASALAADPVAAAGERSARLAKWLTRGFLGIGSLGNLIGAFAAGSLTLGIGLALLAGGQATAAILLSRE